MSKKEPYSEQLVPSPTPFLKIRKKRTKWTEEETESLLNGLRKHGRDYSKICNDKSLLLNPCRRITDVRERTRVLYRTGKLPTDLQNFAVTDSARDTSRLEKRIKEKAMPAVKIIDIRRGAFDEPVVQLQAESKHCSKWISTVHFSRTVTRGLLVEFIKRQSGKLKVALELFKNLQERPEEPLGSHGTPIFESSIDSLRNYSIEDTLSIECTESTLRVSDFIHDEDEENSVEERDDGINQKYSFVNEFSKQKSNISFDREVFETELSETKIPEIITQDCTAKLLPIDIAKECNPGQGFSSTIKARRRSIKQLFHNSGN